MRVELNGRPVELAGDASVAEAVAAAGVNGSGGRGVAVAVDGEVVRRGEWESTALLEGQTVEVVQAVQGG